MKTRLDPTKVRQLAVANGWLEQKVNNGTVLVFNRYVDNSSKKGERLHQQIDVYHTTGTVKTTLKHPRQQRNALFRPACTMDELGMIFKNPRVHLNKGYRSKADRREMVWKDENMKRSKANEKPRPQ